MYTQLRSLLLHDGQGWMVNQPPSLDAFVC